MTRELLGGQVAGLAGVTIRTSHHYDEIGLLSPSGRSAVGYRIYEEADLERLQRILFYRELRFTLEEIATIVDDPCTDVVRHLHRQRELLTERTKRLRDGRGYRLRNGGTDDRYTTNAGGAIRGLR
ncbi:MAG: MerR family transcriptional regulator [Rubrobacter sp.]|nr:MerR family transcriptional regulator [Rubrobacter sp.]